MLTETHQMSSLYGGKRGTISRTDEIADLSCVYSDVYLHGFYSNSMKNELLHSEHLSAMIGVHRGIKKMRGKSN